MQRRLLAAEADRLAWVAGVLAECAADVPAGLVRGSERDEFVRRLAGDEVAATLGVSLGTGRDLVELTARITTVMPGALTALAEAQLDLGRVRVLLEATTVLADDLATRVGEQLVTGLAGPVWDGPSPRAWRARVQRAVVRADHQGAARRRRQALAARRVQSWADEHGVGVLQVRADGLDIALVDQVLTDLAHTRPPADEATGEVTTLDQRRADAFIAVFRQIHDGAPLPAVPVRRVHDLGLVLHTDTLLDHGPRARALAELRGLGAPASLDPTSARTLARRQLHHGSAVQVLLVDDTGALTHVVRLTDPSTCASREALTTAVRESLTHPPPHTTDRYRPTPAIARHVLAEAPNCSSYDCGRRARGCDLDHDDPWPRGPTSVTNLDPKCAATTTPRPTTWCTPPCTPAPAEDPATPPGPCAPASSSPPDQQPSPAARPARGCATPRRRRRWRPPR